MPAPDARKTSPRNGNTVACGGGFTVYQKIRDRPRRALESRRPGSPRSRQRRPWMSAVRDRAEFQCRFRDGRVKFCESTFSTNTRRIRAMRLELEAWRIAGRHLNIADAIQDLDPLLNEALGGRAVHFFRFDPERLRVERILGATE